MANERQQWKRPQYSWCTTSHGRNSRDQKIRSPLEEFYFPDEVKLHFAERFDSLKKKVQIWEDTLDLLKGNKEVGELVSMCLNNNIPDTEYPQFDRKKNVGN